MLPPSLLSYRILPFLSIAWILSLTACADKKEQTKGTESLAVMPMYVIERDVPGAGKMTQQQLKELSQKSCDVLRELGSDIEWDHSYVTEDKLYCVYRAKDSSLIRRHAELGGFPANKITLAGNIITPKTAEMESRE
jgi:hypothetical protein